MLLQLSARSTRNVPVSRARTPELASSSPVPPRRQKLTRNGTPSLSDATALALLVGFQSLHPPQSYNIKIVRQ